MHSKSKLSAGGGVFPVSLPALALFSGSLAGGMVLFALGPTPEKLFFAVIAAAAVGVLLRYPELALALYVVVGDVKGDDRVAALLPVDLTLALGAILLAGIIFNLLRRKPTVPLPGAYFLFVPLVAMMAASLYYTPAFHPGLEKLARFLTVTGIVIVAPFAVLGTPQAMKRFLAGFGLAAFAVCAWSLAHLGGSERLTTPTNNTIGLGHVASALFLLVWLAVVPRYAFPQRILTYPLLAIPALALVGSGSRGSAVACGIVIFLSLLFNRRFLLDLICLLALGIAALPFLNIPDSSLEYLATLAGSRSVSALLSFRGELFGYGWKLLEQHPLFGAGLEGFRYSSPNPAVYKWPHNIFLEIACELGIPAGVIAVAIFGSALREAFRQVRDRFAPGFLLSQLAAALLLAGIVNALNTGDINSDRSTWLFVSLVFVVRGLRLDAPERSDIAVPAARTAPA